ncbi:bifunctional 2-polyprenyl-6-hydroxyphenol methylase/3-demethylubiquinol 3-O-methyltransferase UbiG [Rhizobium sp. SSA_523]|uniref:class I SAM-dependent methyltransferase n=1 Tax=Rhizobium sp. SSA_523 TaxID=2952477 RepID=UPI0020908D76|nr:class I SAM-dependent methyltransferase [Rhizobium sp. SSA_523]MCO5732667.1 class I SAM-dependent methyltransferase [Rhizobium sp. SSA_523]WKC23705.1 class I SAM-dependent methyltransferase [Rhizobium sp. SSA_523]
MIVDDQFAREDMAIFYDSFNQHGEDGAFYLSLPKAPSRILDVGCGTGLLTLSLAEMGHQVTGVDPAEGMLSVAARKPLAGRVRWVRAFAEDFELVERFDLAIMTAHVFQVFPDNAATLAALGNIRRHLVPGGRLVFESRNPAIQEWQNWTRERTAERKELTGIGPVEVYYQWREAEGDHVTFDAVYTLLRTGEQRVSASTLRFADRETIIDLLMAAGFRLQSVCGWWDGAAFDRHTSREMIFSAEA